MTKPISKTVAALLFAAAGFAAASVPARADGVIRHPMSNFPISSAVEVPAGYATIYLAGVGPDPADKAGDTESQARSEIRKLAAELASMHLGLGDIVQMHVFMVADPKTGKMDFAGMMKAYRDFFGTPSQPNLPARAAFQVSAMVLPSMLVEIEAIAVRKP
jgi:enamine deaminase RidA (YjgF/YER057c/UK114 family)